LVFLLRRWRLPKEIFFLICILTFLAYYVNSKSFFLINVTEVEITRYSDQKIVHVTESDQIKKLVKSCRITFMKGDAASSYSAWMYNIKFWRGEKLLDEITIASHVRIIHNNHFYISESDSLDLSYYKKLFD